MSNTSKTPDLDESCSEFHVGQQRIFANYVYEIVEIDGDSISIRWLVDDLSFEDTYSEFPRWALEGDLVLEGLIRELL